MQFMVISVDMFSQPVRWMSAFFGNITLTNPAAATQHKASQTFKGQSVPPANNAGDTCVTVQPSNFLKSSSSSSGGGSGCGCGGSWAVEGSSLQEQRSPSLRFNFQFSSLSPFRLNLTALPPLWKGHISYSSYNLIWLISLERKKKISFQL